MYNGESSSSQPAPQKKTLKNTAGECVEALKAMKIPFGKVLAPVAKLFKLVKLKDDYDELQEEGHSSIASFMGAGASLAAKSTAFVGGASLTVGAFAAAEVPPVAATAATAGVMLMHKSTEAGKLAKHHVPILVDTTLDQLSHVYASATQFVSHAFQQWSSKPDYSTKKFPDIESVMLDLGYKAHVEPIYANLSEEQQLLYSTISRDLFNEQFKLYTDYSVKAEPSFVHPTKPYNVDISLLKGELSEVQDQLAKEVERFENGKASQIDLIIKEQNKQLSQHLTPLVNQANQASLQDSNLQPQVNKSESIVQNAHEFCEVLNATSQGLSLVARISGNSRVANKIIQSSMAASQIISGVAAIAENGLSAGPVGMVFGGMNMLVACFGEEDSGMEALAEQLAVISNQIHALHEDMLNQFAKVFTALGIINTNIIEGFKLLHETQEVIFKEIGRLQKSLALLQNSVSLLQDSSNAIGHQIHDLRSELRGYIIEDDRKQLQLHLNTLREAIKRPYNRAKLQPKLIATFKTYNEELIARQIAAPFPSSAEITRALTTQLGSAEANIGLLLNYAKHELNLDIKQPIADPEQWRHSTEILIQVIGKESHAHLEEQDYKDFEYFKTIGDNWLYLINQFKSVENHNPLSTLFKKYRNSVKLLVSLLNQEVDPFEKTKRESKFKHQGMSELKKQQAFTFNFRRNEWYRSLRDYYPLGTTPIHWWGDEYVGEWSTHIDNRKKEINKKLEAYQEEIKQAEQIYENISPALFKITLPEDTQQHSASSFMMHETEPDTMPLLPLQSQPVQIPTYFIEAEQLELGQIQHLYRFEKGMFEMFFFYTIRFRWNEPSLLPVTIFQGEKNCSFPTYLDSEEAAWHAYMGGNYPVNDSYTHEYRSATNSKCGRQLFSIRYFCAMPTLASFDGLRNTFSFQQQRINANVEVVTAVRDRIKKWRHDFNKKIAQDLKSSDPQNALAAALCEVDASAKLLTAFMSIIFRETYQKPSAVWSYEEIIDFVQHYRGQDVYLIHQLEANLEYLEFIEQDFINQLYSQTESAYTPVKETLEKLNDFLLPYQSRVVDETEQHQLDRSCNVTSSDGATQAIWLMQDLVKRGHPEAALQVLESFSRLNLGTLPLSLDSASTSQIYQESKGLYFSKGPMSHNASNEASSSLSSIEVLNEDEQADSKQKGKEKVRKKT